MDKGCALGPNSGINEEDPPVSQISRFAFDRRSLLGGAASLLAAPALVRAQAKALKIAVLLPRSGNIHRLRVRMLPNFRHFVPTVLSFQRQLQLQKQAPRMS